MASLSYLKYRSILALLLGWAVYTILCASLQANEVSKNYAELLLAVGDIAISTIGAIYAARLWSQAKGPAKRIIGFFALSFCSIAVVSIVYHVTNYILHIPHEQRSNLVSSLCNIPYLGYLIFQFLMFAYLLFQGKIFKKDSRFSMYIPILIVAAIFILILAPQLLSQSITYSLNDFYATSGKTFEVIGFIMAAICLAISRNRGIFFISLGFLIAQASDLIIDFGIFSQKYGIGSVLETLWVLFYLFIIYGAINLKQSGAYREEPQTWVSEIDSLKSQTTIWCLILCAFFLSIFFGVSYLFSPNKLFF